MLSSSSDKTSRQGYKLSNFKVAKLFRNELIEVRVEAAGINKVALKDNEKQG